MIFQEDKFIHYSDIDPGGMLVEYQKYVSICIAKFAIKNEIGYDQQIVWLVADGRTGESVVKQQEHHQHSPLRAYGFYIKSIAKE